jgi:hypothetical protein
MSITFNRTEQRTMKRLNVEHRTSNIDDAVLYLILKPANHPKDVILRPRSLNSRFALGLRSHFGGVSLLSIFLN